jgi:type III pantothenate kinase
MSPRLVADIGNTRINWGICSADGLADAAAVPPDDPAAWAEQLKAWQLDGPCAWAIAGVHPARRDRLTAWLRGRGDAVRVIADYRELPLRVDVDAPERVGIDRLLNAVAVLPRVPAGTAAVIIDAGSAVTVDLVDGAGVFRGGAIFPGLRLMARALHEHTAQLPLIETPHDADPPLPGRNTAAAIQAGITSAVVGGIDRLVELYLARSGPAIVYFTGGSVALAAVLRRHPVVTDPLLTLDGLRRTAWPTP